MDNTNDLRWLLKMVRTVLIAIAMIVVPIHMIGCSPSPTETGWTLVGHTPGSREENARGIYKMHDNKEKVTFYATRTYGDYWVISVVKD